MPVFIPIYCDFELLVITSMQYGHAPPIHLEVRTSLTRITVDGAISPTYTLPGMSAGRLQDVVYIGRPIDVTCRESYRPR